ncbi:MAG: hypothetical protein K6E30_06440 [Lachnospiraceae bacterium]|nr:hypothetical protein [Lachnospiraceae bacterium]
MKNDSGRIGWNRLAVFIKETLFYWRFILLVCVCCALLAGGLQTARFLLDRKSGEPSEVQLSDEEELERRVYEIGAEAVRLKLASRQEYLTNSILVHLDPCHTVLANASIMISSGQDGGELADAVMNSILFYGIRQIDWTELAEEEETEACYLDELVSVSGNSEDNIVNITVRHFDEEKAEKILDYILQKMEIRDKELQEEIGGHDYRLLNKHIGIYIDTSYEDWTENRVNTIYTLQSALSNFSEKANKYSPDASGVSKKSILKMALYGAVGGGLAALVILFLMLLEKNLLLSPDELKDSYGIPLLAVFPQRRKRHKTFVFIDRMIEKIGCYPTEKLTDGERYLLIAEKIRQLTGPGAGKRLALAGDVPEELLKKTAESLALEMKDAEIIPAANLTTDPAAVRAVGTSEAVILLAGREKTRMSEMDRTVCAVRELDRKILGGIVVC